MQGMTTWTPKDGEEYRHKRVPSDPHHPWRAVHGHTRGAEIQCFLHGPHLITTSTEHNWAHSWAARHQQVFFRVFVK